jgi:hypothetical protein
VKIPIATVSASILLFLALGCTTGKSPETSKAPRKSNPADNSRCFACHETYQDDLLTQIHGKSGVGCGECHGRSKAHEEDKSSRVAPEVMFTADSMAPFCATCHATHDAPAVKVIRQWQKRCAGKNRPEEATCTDCHGSHRMKGRTIRWDRKTGERLPT